VQTVSKTVLLFIATAIAELVGCYLPYLCLRKGGSPWLLVPAAVSLAIFSWLLSLHPTASGRVYAAYGGVYVAMAVLWLWLVDGVRPTRWDLVGAFVTLIGMAIILFAPRQPDEDARTDPEATSIRSASDASIERSGS
jgi:small multidrug resistance family-3 protein